VMRKTSTEEAKIEVVNPEEEVERPKPHPPQKSSMTGGPKTPPEKKAY